MPNILVVDDSSVTRRALSHMLKKGGHVVVLAESAQQALDYLAGAAVDLAIIDLHMPEMDGLRLLRELRTHKRTQSLPVVVLTTSGQDEDRIRAREEGVSGFLTKPASSREVIETIERLLVEHAR